MSDRDDTPLDDRDEAIVRMVEKALARGESPQRIRATLEGRITGDAPMTPEEAEAWHNRARKAPNPYRIA